MKVKDLVEYLHEKDQEAEVFIDLYVLSAEKLTKGCFEEEGNMLLIQPKNSLILSDIYDKIEDLYSYTTKPL